MKYFSRLIIVFAAVVLSTYAIQSYAEVEKFDKDDLLAALKAKTEEFKAELELTDKQFEELKVIWEKYFDSKVTIARQISEKVPKAEDGGRVKLRDKRKFRKETKELREQLDEINKKEDVEVLQVLTEEQFAKYAAIREEFREKRREQIKERMNSAN